MTLALQEIAQACRSLKGNALKQQLYAVFEEKYTTFSRISQKVGKKKYRLGELVQVITERGAETQIIIGFDGFSQGNRLTLEDLDENASVYFVLANEQKQVMFWPPNAIENVKEDWEQGVLQVVEELENWLAYPQKD